MHLNRASQEGHAREREKEHNMVDLFVNWIVGAEAKGIGEWKHRDEGKEQERTELGHNMEFTTAMEAILQTFRNSFKYFP